MVTPKMPHVLARVLWSLPTDCSVSHLCPVATPVAPNPWTDHTDSDAQAEETWLPWHHFWGPEGLFSLTYLFPQFRANSEALGQDPSAYGTL